MMIAQTQALAAPAPRPRRAKRRKRVLLVEDDADMRRLVGAVLRQAGYQVDEAPNGVAMLRQIEAAIWHDRPDHYDAIVADILLPDLTALEVLEALQSRDLSAPVILMTAHGSDHARAEACALGAFALLDKPLDWDLLRAAVRKAIRVRRS